MVEVLDEVFIIEESYQRPIEEVSIAIKDKDDLIVETWKLDGGTITKLWCKRCKEFLGQSISDEEGIITIPSRDCQHFKWVKEDNRLVLTRRH